MKHSISLPVLLAPSFLGGEDPRAIHPPFFTTCLLLSPILFPVGLVAGMVYLCSHKWRAAGLTMMGMGLSSGLIFWLVYASLH